MTNPVNERWEPQSFCEIQLNPQVAFAESEVSVTMKEAGYPGLCPERTSSASRSVGFFLGFRTGARS